MEKIKIKLTKELPEEFKKYWRTKDFMKIGWETWTAVPLDKGEIDDENGGILTVHPEKNKYYINFPADYFEYVD